jgi:cytochrome c553
MFKRILVLALLVGVMAACSSGGRGAASFAELPAGDAARGATLFTESVSGAPACSTCHALDERTISGPSLQGYGSRAGTRISGMSAEDYTFQSMMRPSAFIVPGFTNLMYNNYEAKLSSQNIADLIAFLLSQ